MELSLELGVPLAQVYVMPVRHAALYAEVFRLRAEAIDAAANGGEAPPERGSEEDVRAALTARAARQLEQQRTGRR